MRLVKEMGGSNQPSTKASTTLSNVASKTTISLPTPLWHRTVRLPAPRWWVLTGRYTRDQQTFEPGSRFDLKIAQGTLHRGRYWNEEYFDGLEIIKEAADKHGLTLAEVALRWMEHHSTMEKEFGDEIIVGTSSVKHLEEDLEDLEKGPLPEDVLEALEKAWAKTRGVTPKYWH